MIKITFQWAIATIIFFSIGLVFFVWVFYNFWNFKIIKSSRDKQDVIQCKYCTCVFLKNVKENYVKCPRCQSYIN